MYASYNFAVDGANYEIVSAARRLAILRVQDGAARRALSVREDPATPTSPVWFEKMLFAANEVRGGGFHAVDGRTSGAGAYAYRLLVVPYWMTMTALTLWPAAWTSTRLRRAARRRRWRAANRCGRCGYDLRGHTTQGRCPECGHQNGPSQRVRSKAP